MRQLRQAFRRLMRDPGFSLLAIATLALGIAANTAIFGVVNGVLLKPFPYPDPDRLIMPGHSAPGLDLHGIGQAPAAFLRYREHNRSFTGMALFRSGTVGLTGDGEPERVDSAEVSGSFFGTIGLPPALGRDFRLDEEQPGTAPVVVISDPLWRRRFGADPAILGRSIVVDGIAREVVGVAREGFRFPGPAELWTPMTLDPANVTLGEFGTAAVARMRDGVTVEEAVADLNRLIADLEKVFPDQQAAPVLARAGFVAEARSVRDSAVGDVESRLWILLGSVGVVLLIACANVANLFLVRSEARHRDTAVRVALGATRGRLAGEAIAESLLLAAAAGALGLVAAGWATRLLVRFGPPDLPRLAEVTLDIRVVLFDAGVALLTGLAFGLVPLFQPRLAELAETLRDAARGTTSGRKRILARRALVSAQVALAVVVLVASGLMVRSFANLAKVEPGFRAGNVLTAQVALPETAYTDDLSAERFFAGLEERLRALPGVEAAGVGSWLPLSGQFSGSGHRFFDRPDETQELPTVLGTVFATAGYVETMGIPLREGRLLDRGDAERRTGAVLVSRSLAEARWPGESALGKRIFPGRPESREGDPWYSVVGVVGDIRANLTEDPPEVVYYPILAKEADTWTIRQATVVVRTTGDPRALTDGLRRAVWDLDPNLPIAGIGTLEDRLRDARGPMAFTVVLLLIAGSVSLLLGAIGTFGIVSYLVTQRTSEIGVRMALGARTADVAAMVLREGFVLVGIGAALGLAVAAAVTRWLGSILFEVSPLDPMTFLAVPLVLWAAALLATWVPTRRATRIDPAVALRSQ